MQLNKLKTIFPKNKKTAVIIALILSGLILALLFGGGSKSAEEPENLAEYKAQIEKELENLCSSVDGVGKCKVTVSFSSGVESTYKNGKLVETKPPKILGVAVACKGGDSPRVKQALSELLTSLYDIPTNRVAILKLN